MKQILTGNEAIARGAWEAGCRVASAYPGTPSSEILETIAAKYGDISSEWSVNEKVATEIAAGASIAGARSLCAMKHVGLNVAADPLFTMSYIGATGGMVVVSADDPGLFSSQNEQDNRWYALHAKIPMLEPSDSEECRTFTKDAFEISERFDSPVLLRVTTRVCHSKSIVDTEERDEQRLKDFEHLRAKRVMVPANARNRRVLIDEREEKLREFANSCRYNVIEAGTENKIGVITSGISYQHAHEAFAGMEGKVSFLKLGLTYPLPGELIEKFAAGKETIYIVEENEPYIESFVRQLGIKCVGREKLPAIGELDASIVRKCLVDNKDADHCASDTQLPPRPPVLCPGCSHRGFFYELSKYDDIAVSSDIGCYTLGVAPPLSVGDCVICMGAGVSAGIGIEKALRSKGAPASGGIKVKKVFGVIGDSTFFHSGITALIDAAMNGSSMVLCILDNRTTAMTGHQENPGTGRTISGEPTTMIDLVELCAACGVKRENIRRVDCYVLKEVADAIRDARGSDELFVIITTQPCALIKEVAKKRADMYCSVAEDECVGCRMCMKVGCPAVSMRGKIAHIDKEMCNGCSICAQMCAKKAIKEAGESR